MTVGGVVDTLLDRSVVLGFSQIGLSVRSRLPGWPADPPGDALLGRAVAVTGALSVTVPALNVALPTPERFRLPALIVAPLPKSISPTRASKVTFCVLVSALLPTLKLLPETVRLRAPIFSALLEPIVTTPAVTVAAAS